MSKKKNPSKPLQSSDDPFYDIRNVASFTECTGLVPANVEDNAEAQAYGELYAIHPPKAPK